MKPLTYDLIKLSYMNIEKGNLLHFNTINSKTILDNTTKTSAKIYLQDPSQFENMLIRGIYISPNLSLESEDITPSSCISINTGGDSLSVIITASTNQSNPSILNFHVETSDGYDNIISGIKNLNTFLKTYKFQGRTLAEILLMLGHEISVSKESKDCPKSFYNKMLDAITLELSESNVTNEYVWVNLNNLDLNKYDMVVYDTRFNGTIVNISDTDYIFFKPFNLMKYKGTHASNKNVICNPITGTTYFSDVDQYVNSIMDLTTGPYSSDLLAFGEEEYTISPYNHEYDYLIDYAQYDGYGYIRLVDEDEKPLSDIIGSTIWLPVSSEDWDLSWFEIKTKVLNNKNKTR